MKKRILHLATVFLAVSTLSFAQNQTVLMDFGDPATGYISASPWNNVSNTLTTSTAATLTDDLGNSTGYSLVVTDNFFAGYNTTGATAPTGAAALVFPATATKDNFYLGINWSGVSEPTGAFNLTGLDPTKYYSFVIFASRTSVTDIRTGLYTVTGEMGNVTATLNASNNTSNVATIQNIMPTAAGIISFKAEAASDNNNVNKFVYLGAIKMVRSDVTTSLSKTTKPENLNAIYKNGNLKINNYTGQIELFNLTGKCMAQGNMVFGYLTIKLDNGIYFVKTTIGNTKFIVD